MNSNQYYGALNKRFEKRSKLLRSCGFVYRLAEEGIATFTRKNPFNFNKHNNIAAAEVMHANNFAWRDVLARNLKRGLVLG